MQPQQRAPVDDLANTLDYTFIDLPLLIDASEEDAWEPEEEPTCSQSMHPFAVAPPAGAAHRATTAAAPLQPAQHLPYWKQLSTACQPVASPLGALGQAMLASSVQPPQHQQPQQHQQHQHQHFQQQQQQQQHSLLLGQQLAGAACCPAGVPAPHLAGAAMPGGRAAAAASGAGAAQADSSADAGMDEG